MANTDVINHTDPRLMSLERKPAWLRERLSWFQDMKLGIIIHWGPYSGWDCAESWGLVPEDTWARRDEMECWVSRGRDLARFQADYRALNRSFNPAKFDPDGWARAIRDAGAQYVTFTTKHHDGFCMWDTATTEYRITAPDCPYSANPRADVTKHFFDALRRNDLAVSAYFSKSDWHCPWYWSPDFPIVDRNPNYDYREHPEVWARFVRFVHDQIRELMTNYGKIDILWLDGGQVRPPHQDIDMPSIAEMARSLQPGLLIADRTVGGDYEDFITPEHVVLDEPLEYPWESCLTLGSGWKHNPRQMTYGPAAKTIRTLVDIVAKGGNLLLGVGPTAEGEIDEVALARLAEIGEWMRTNGEAIYGTRPLAPFVDGNLRFSQKGDRRFVFVFPNDDEVYPQVVGIPLSVVTRQARRVEAVQVLGYPDRVSVEVTGADGRPHPDDSVSITLPRRAVADGAPCLTIAIP